MLQAHPRANVRAEGDELALTIRVKLEHLDGISKIEVENLLAGEAMNDGEGVRREQVIDARREGARAGVCGWERGVRDLSGGSVRLAEIAAFDGERLEMEELAEFVGGEIGHGGLLPDQLLVTSC